MDYAAADHGADEQKRGVEMAHIYLASPHMSAEGYEQEYIKEAFDTNWIAPLGKNVNEFEKELSAYVGAKDAAALSAGSAALHLALKAAGVGEGDIVFCQDLTFSATANPIVYEKAGPVFIDSDYETWNMSPEALTRAFEKYPNVKAVMPVHLYGLPADMDRIVEICRKHGVPIIEDAAESLGSIYHGQMTGTFGDYGAFSFNGNKIITTSGGGMLVCNLEEEKAKERIKKVRFWATQSREPARHYEHKEIGYNYRMSNIVAGIGRGQLKVLDQRIEQKRHIFAYYQEHLGDLPGLGFMPVHEDERANCWLSVIQLADDGPVRPLDVMIALEKGDIESRPVWKPMHLQPVFAGCDYIDNGDVGATLFRRGVCLPSDTKLTDEDLARICEIIRGLWK